jgi:hypothetical protein
MNVRERLNWYKLRYAELQEQLDKAGGIVRHEFWRLEYFRDPYLLFVSDAELKQRFFDVNQNMEEYNEEGLLSFDRRLLEKRDETLISAFAHMIEEIQARFGGLPQDFFEEGRERTERYRRDGEMLGVTMFRGKPIKHRGSIVKFTKKQFAEEMMNDGKILLSPASFYADGSLLKSMKDLETSRVFRIPAIAATLSGHRFCSVEDNILTIEGGAATWTHAVPDYYLYSTCLELDRRMPSDFEADAAVVITDRRRFVHALKKAFKKHFGQSNVDSGEVVYYDPFRPPEIKRLEFMKHFAYAYQREFRVVARPISGMGEPERVKLKLGSMKEYSELISAE